MNLKIVYKLALLASFPNFVFGANFNVDASFQLHNNLNYEVTTKLATYNTLIRANISAEAPIPGRWSTIQNLQTNQGFEQIGLSVGKNNTNWINTLRDDTTGNTIEVHTVPYELEFQIHGQPSKVNPCSGYDASTTYTDITRPVNDPWADDEGSAPSAYAATKFWIKFNVNPTSNVTFIDCTMPSNSSSVSKDYIFEIYGDHLSVGIKSIFSRIVTPANQIKSGTYTGQVIMNACDNSNQCHVAAKGVKTNYTGDIYVNYTISIDAGETSSVSITDKRLNLVDKKNSYLIDRKAPEALEANTKLRIETVGHGPYLLYLSCNSASVSDGDCGITNESDDTLGVAFFVSQGNKHLLEGTTVNNMYPLKSSSKVRLTRRDSDTIGAADYGRQDISFLDLYIKTKDGETDRVYRGHPGTRYRGEVTVHMDVSYH